MTGGGERLGARELMRRVLAGRPAPRTPVGPLAVHYCAALAGVSVRRYTTDSGALAECVIRYWERFRPDAVWLSADTWVTAEAMGAKVRFSDDNQPLVGTGEPLVRSAADIDRISDPDPNSQGRWPLMLDAFRRIKRAIGSEAFLVACFDQYPFSLACALMGVERLMVALADDPPLVDALLARCADYTVAYATALASEGPDMLSGGDSPAGLIGPARYRRFAAPWERRVIERLRAAAGPAPVSLHICGDTTPILADMAATGADVLELDYLTDLDAACRVAPERVALWGNLDPVAVLAQGSPEDVRRAAARVLDVVRRAGRRRFVLSSGCTLALETPPENVAALVAAARRT